MGTPVTAYPFKDALNELRQKYEKSGLLKTARLAISFTKQHGDLLIKLDDPDGRLEQGFRVLCKIAEKHKRAPLDPEVYVKAILESALVAAARESEAKALAHVARQYDQHMPKLVKVHARSLSNAKSDEETGAQLEAGATLRELHAYGGRIKKARKEAPEIDKGGTPGETLLKESLSNLVYELVGERRDDEVAALAAILLDRKISPRSVRSARRWRKRK
jgi:hypothetical protein